VRCSVTTRLGGTDVWCLVLCSLQKSRQAPKKCSTTTSAVLNGSKWTKSHQVTLSPTLHECSSASGVCWMLLAVSNAIALCLVADCTLGGGTLLWSYVQIVPPGAFHAASPAPPDLGVG